MRKAWLFIAILQFLALSAAASYISFDTKLTSKVENDVLKVTISAINKGDEPAYNVQAEIKAGSKKMIGDKAERVEINGVYTVEISLKPGFPKAGHYPLVLFLHYTDANQYPFSALTCKTFSYQAEDSPAEILGKIDTTAFWEKGKAKLTLKNMGRSELDASTYLVVPRELSTLDKAISSKLAPKSSARLEFDLENFSALSGSTYQVFAVSEYEKEGKHQTQLSPGLIRVVERRDFLGIDYVYLIAALIIMVLIFIVFQLGIPFFKK